MEIIQFIGADALDDFDKDKLNKLSTEYYDKIKKKLHNVTSLKVHVKEYSKGGSKEKFSVHINAIAPTRIFEATASDWDFARTLHMAFGSIQKQIEHAFHSRTRFYQHKA